MDSLLLSEPLLLSRLRPSSPRRTPTFFSSLAGALPASTAARFLSLPLVASDRLKRSLTLPAAAMSGGLTANSIPSKNVAYTVGDFMTKKEDLQVVKPTTTVDEALEDLVEHRISGFPVIDDDWKLVGVVSDYDLLALDSISGGTLIDVLPIGSGRNETSLFPEADSTWKTFNEIQKLLSKTNGKVIAEVMTPAPLVVRETTNLEDAARLLLETKFRRLPVVDSAGRLVGIITRGNVVRAALQIKHANEKMSQT